MFIICRLASVGILRRERELGVYRLGWHGNFDAWFLGGIISFVVLNPLCGFFWKSLWNSDYLYTSLSNSPIHTNKIIFQTIQASLENDFTQILLQFLWCEIKSMWTNWEIDINVWITERFEFIARKVFERAERKYLYINSIQ